MLSRVKIIDTGYNEKHHIVFWKIRNIETNDHISLALRADELVQNFLNNPNVTVTAKEITDFNQNMKGKEINWDTTSMNNKSVKEFENMTEEEWKNMNEDINSVPLPEVSAILNGQ